MNRPIILSFISHYLPGYKCGGPVRSLANMVDQLQKDFDFRIVTTDRDLGEVKPYLGISGGKWREVNGAQVLYLDSQCHSLRDITRVIKGTPHNVLYLNSGFDRVFTLRILLMRLLGWIPGGQIMVAARGVFSRGAIGIKAYKKRIFVAVARSIGLYRGVIWQASTALEEADIRRWLGKDANVVIAPNLPPVPRDTGPAGQRRVKISGSLNIVFLSRISPKKNLLAAIGMLHGLKGQICFNICGPVEDQTYWAECQKAATALPGNIKVKYLGSIPPEEVGAVLADNDLFFFPTLGENFGHVILEALCAGCPVLISDQTPWRGLTEIGAGWDLPLNSAESFQRILGACAGMGESEYRGYSDTARKYGIQIMGDQGAVEKNRSLFKLCAE